MIAVSIANRLERLKDLRIQTCMGAKRADELIVLIELIGLKS